MKKEPSFKKITGSFRDENKFRNVLWKIKKTPNIFIIHKNTF